MYKGSNRICVIYDIEVETTDAIVEFYEAIGLLLIVDATPIGTRHLRFQHPDNEGAQLEFWSPPKHPCGKTKVEFSCNGELETVMHRLLGIGAQPELRSSLTGQTVVCNDPIGNTVIVAKRPPEQPSDREGVAQLREQRGYD